MNHNDLQDISIVNTRPRKQSKPLTALLEAMGAEVISFPTIKISKITDETTETRFHEALRNLSDYRWLIFTSINSVEIFFEALSFLQINHEILHQLKIAVIGDQTRLGLSKRGVDTLICPKDFRAESLLQAILDEDSQAIEQGARILLPRAKEAREILPQSLMDSGARVDLIPVYETVAESIEVEPLWQRFQSKTIDCITFTSSSTVSFFFKMFSSQNLFLDFSSIVTACIGPITAETLEKHGVKPSLIASTYTAKGLADCIREYYTKHKE